LNDVEYAGFWIRLGATVVDMILITVITAPVLYLLYGSVYGDANNPEIYRGMGEVVVSWIAPAIATILFWRYRQATPGKM
ncbi:RDD family protein, partial [Klebsiella pneumoniae]|uniref:RDD family protein n=2 Tax=Pseudomonadota TaxID=1224 RepID=UPI0022BA0EB3